MNQENVSSQFPELPLVMALEPWPFFGCSLPQSGRRCGKTFKRRHRPTTTVEEPKGQTSLHQSPTLEKLDNSHKPRVRNGAVSTSRRAADQFFTAFLERLKEEKQLARKRWIGLHPLSNDAKVHCSRRQRWIRHFGWI